MLRIRLLFLSLILPLLLPAKVQLPAFFSDHMVLQQNSLSPLWGRAGVGESIEVRVSWEEISLQTYADSKGIWRVDLATPAAGGPHWIEIEGENVLRIEDVLIGEVWLASGQSNMNWPLSRSDGGAAEAQQANRPMMRFFQVERDLSLTPRFDCKGKWVLCSPETAPKFSGVAYHFAKKIQEELEVPVGVIQSTWGGTPAEAWTSRAGLERLTAAKPLLNRFDEDLRQYRENKTGPDPVHAKNPTTLYNAMIAPLAHYAMQGVIWYQGETNVSDPYLYETLFPGMIQDWRRAWGRRFSFYYAQLAPYARYAIPQAGAGLRDAQRLSMNVPNSGMVVTLDVGNPQDIHPTDKHTVGLRFARWALHRNYHQETVIPSGPMYRGMERKGGQLRLLFDYAEDGLVASGELAGFELAGPDRQFYPAQAKIDGKEVILSSPEVSEAVAARYAFENGSEATLFNKEGLPASSFRTDEWPMFFTQPQIDITFNRSRNLYQARLSYRQAISSRLYYSLDGSEVTQASTLYTGPIALRAPASIQAQAFIGQEASPFPVQRSMALNRAVQAEVVSATPGNSAFVGDWRDGLTASSNYLDGYWAAWQGKDVELVIDLGKKEVLSRVALNLLQDARRRVLWPTEIEIQASNNGRKFHSIARWEGEPLSQEENQVPKIMNWEGSFEKEKSRYLKLILKNPGVMPDWHGAKGDPTWLMLDEWIVE